MRKGFQEEKSMDYYIIHKTGVRYTCVGAGLGVLYMTFINRIRSEGHYTLIVSSNDRVVALQSSYEAC